MQAAHIPLGIYPALVDRSNILPSTTKTGDREIKETPEQAFMRLYASITEKMDRIKSQADNHFGVDPDSIHWGNVGDMGRIDRFLSELEEALN